MPDLVPEPISIEAIRSDHLLMIRWSDGHCSDYDFEYLRWRCPCAECQGEGGQSGILSLIKTFSPQQIEMVDLQVVGRYALAPRWADGHSSGLYSFEFLRGICSCEDCQYSDDSS